MKQALKTKSLCNKYKKKSVLNYLGLYTILFLFFTLFILIWFVLANKTLLYKVDGLHQHYTSLRYFGMYCRNIIKTLLTTGRLIIPNYDFTLGYGSDVLTTLHYYVIGDPLDLLTIIVPAKYTQYLYYFLIFFRLYLSGIAFSLFAKIVYNTERFATLVSSLSYAFCLYALVGGTKHAYFINPMIYFPLVLLGIENIFKGKKPYLFIIMIFVSAISNFYFFYMIAVLMIIYAVFRFFRLYKKDILKNAFSYLLKFAIFSLIGVCMAGIIFVPVVMAMFSTNRAQSSGTVSLLYPMVYYRDILLSFISASVGNEEWRFLGYSPLILFSIIVMHIRYKSDKSFIRGFWFLTIMLFIPAFGYALNGFSYVTNRWVWAYSLLVCIIAAINLPYFKTLSKEQWIKFLKVMAVYFSLCLIAFCLTNSKSSSGIGIIVLAICMCIMAIFGLKNTCVDKIKSERIYKTSICSVLIIGILFVTYAEFSPRMNNHTSIFAGNQSLDACMSGTVTNEIRKIQDKNNTYFRYDSYDYNDSDRNTNASTYYSVHANGGFFSLNSPNMSNLYSDICEEQTTEQLTMGYNSRTMPLYLSATKYFIAKNKNYLPYAYTDFVKKSKGKLIYENPNALPLGYTYSSYLSHSEYEKLSPTQKQQAMLQSVVVNDEDKFVVNSISEKSNLHFTDKELAYKISNNSENVVIKDKSITTFAKNQKIVLKFEQMPNSELYIRFKNLMYNPQNPIEKNKATGRWYKSENASKIKKIVDNFFWKGNDSALVCATTKDTNKAIQVHTPNYPWYSNRHDYDLCVGYSKEGLPTVTITFDEAGIYSFDDIKVVGVDMKNINSDVAKLGKETLNNMKYGNDEVVGTVDLSDNKLLCLALPYSDGWSAYVDGKKTDIISSNVAYMGVMLTKGHHEITFKYKTPYINFGICASAIGTLAFVGVVFIEQKRKKKVEEKEYEVIVDSSLL